MGKNAHLRRSRSWKDLSAFMSRRIFGDDDVPKVPLQRTSSLERGKQDTKSRMFNDVEMDNLVKNILTPEEQRAREREFQRRANTKRKLIPTQTTTPPQSIAKPPQPRETQLPGFTFSQQTLTKRLTKVSHTPSSSSVQNMSPLSFHSRSQSNAGHSRKASEISVPMVMDFDLTKHQNSKMFSPDGSINVGLRSTKMERELSSEEKLDLINTVPPMHVVNLPKVESKSKGSTLKRLFSLRRNEKSPVHRRIPSSSKPSPPQNFAEINNYNSSRKSIYTRPQPISRPLSPPPSPTKRDAPPRLTVQIPDSTMDRASKIFQSIYIAHAQAQESFTSRWEVATPPSDSPPSSLHSHDVKYVKSLLEHRPIPNPKSTWGLLPPARIAPIAEAQKRYSFRRQSTRIQSGHVVEISGPIEEHRQSTYIGSNRDSHTGPFLRGRISAFPVPASTKSMTISVEDMIVESDLSDEEYSEDSDEEWEDEDFGSSGNGSLKEPAWEMLTPPTRIAVV